jgi:hypothetical protein
MRAAIFVLVSVERKIRSDGDVLQQQRAAVSMIVTYRPLARVNQGTNRHRESSRLACPCRACIFSRYVGIGEPACKSVRKPLHRNAKPACQTLAGPVPTASRPRSTAGQQSYVRTGISRLALLVQQTANCGRPRRPRSRGRAEKALPPQARDDPHARSRPRPPW